MSFKLHTSMFRQTEAALQKTFRSQKCDKVRIKAIALSSTATFIKFCKTRASLYRYAFKLNWRIYDIIIRYILIASYLRAVTILS